MERKYNNNKDKKPFKKDFKDNKKFGDRKFKEDKKYFNLLVETYLKNKGE